MLVIGAGGLVLQILDDLIDRFGDRMVFWTDQSLYHPFLKGYTILQDENSVIDYFNSHGNEFVIGIGNPEHRKRLCGKFEGLGGVAKSFISPKASISRFARIEDGAVVLQGAVIEAGVWLEKGVLVNVNSVITHEAEIGAFTEIGPGVVMAGKVTTGQACFIGVGATIIPRIVLGKEVVVGAGSLVIGNVPDFQKVIGVPAKPLVK